MSHSPERDLVERPFVEQLVSMGWKHIAGNVDHPSVTGRTSFRDVLLRADLVEALGRINLRDGVPWLDPTRIAQAIAALEHPATGRLLEINQAATDVLLKGTFVDGLPDWDHGRDRHIAFIDWDHPENNVFRVVDQFRVDEPGGQGGGRYIVPDIVLFVNGVPLVVVECKSPGIPEPIAKAVEDLQGYANQRDWIAGNEGNEQLFHTNQLVVATCYDEARLATFCARAAHYLEWKDTAPVPMAEVAEAIGKRDLSSQERLVAGALRPAHLLDIVRHFTLFRVDEGHLVKIVGRYPQFRAVHRAIERLRTGARRAEDGEHDRRGGIVWHTQGSGKSLTMVFLIRRMRSDPALRGFKIVIVTDRTQLEEQLVETAVLTEEPLTVVKRERRGLRTVSALDVLQETLRRPGKDLVFAMIQKYRGTEASADDEAEGEADETPPGALPVLNESEKILVIVDEAHRSHTNTLHANLLRALPNCARIGFTGTPILMGQKRYTDEIFGEFVDRYLLRESEEDGATVKIVYEGRTADAAVRGGGRLDDLFDDMFRAHSAEEIAAIQRRYATRGDVLEAPALIADKARNMLRHYVENVLPSGFKAQVVAVSRRAAVRYREAFLVARHDLVARLASLDPARIAAPGPTDPETAFLARAHRFLPTLREMEFAPVISGGGKSDDPSWSEWTDPAKAKERIERFKKPFVHADDKTHRLPAILIVKSMLLTGFDAPAEQALYLDRRMEGAELLQAIARVNRTYGDKKRAGMVVDYFGVTAHLQDALSVYNASDIVGALRSLKQEEIDRLAERRDAALDVLASNGAGDLSDDAACLAVLADARVRRDFQEKLRDLLAALDLVLPRPEALPYVADAKALAFLQARARNRYRGGGRLIGAEVGEKVRKLIDDHIVSRGIDVSIAPISLTDARFFDHLAREATPRDRAEELTHAIREHIAQHGDEDPGHYQKLSERLDDILHEFEDRWEELAEALERLAAQARAGRAADPTGLDPAIYGPFLDALRSESKAGEAALPDLTRRLVDHVRQQVRRVDFWGNVHAPDALRKWIVDFLDNGWNGGEIVPFDDQGPLADRLMELAKKNDAKLKGAP